VQSTCNGESDGTTRHAAIRPKEQQLRGDGDCAPTGGRLRICEYDLATSELDRLQEGRIMPIRQGRSSIEP
jgi:hypothetical protein